MIRTTVALFVWIGMALGMSIWHYIILGINALYMVLRWGINIEKEFGNGKNYFSISGRGT